MNDRAAMEMMMRCSEEIKMLRRRISELEPKAHAYDTMTIVLGLLPRPPQGMAEDLAWKLDKEAAAIRQQLELPKAAGHPTSD